MTVKPIAEHADGSVSGPETSAAQQDCEKHREDLLDSALKESFPASDPPSIAQPAMKGC